VATSTDRTGGPSPEPRPTRVGGRLRFGWRTPPRRGLVEEGSRRLEVIDASARVRQGSKGGMTLPDGGGVQVVVPCSPLRNYAAWRKDRWCRPPTSGLCTILPAAGSSMGLGSGASFVEREVRARLRVILEVASQDSAQVSFAQGENVVETLSPGRTDQALRERILPGAVRCRKNFLDPHALHAVAKLFAIHLVTVAQEIGRRGGVRERGDDLLGGPGGGGDVR
jgi:hypothetical protein